MIGDDRLGDLPELQDVRRAVPVLGDRLHRASMAHKFDPEWIG
jgi:hypothetical protein